MRALLLAFMLIISGFFIATADVRSAESGFIEHKLKHDGLMRSYLVHLPNGQKPSSKVPMVIVLHGAGGNGKIYMRMTEFDKKADKEGFIVVFPNGTGPKDDILTWNSWNCCGYAHLNKVDDVGFIEKMITEMIKTYPVDPDRIYACGMSNGGMMVYNLAAKLSDQLAAVASVSGAMNASGFIPTRPLSVMIIHGTEDKRVLYNGGKPESSSGKARMDNSVAFASNFWISFDKCETTPLKKKIGDNVMFEIYQNGKQGTEVVVVTIFGGKHAWPGAADGNYRYCDKAVKNLSATDEIWSFFSRHSLHR